MTERIDRELVLDVDIAALWLALTDDGWLEQWLADEVELDLRPGGEARFRIGEAQRSGWVEEIKPPRPAGRSGRGSARLTFWWSQDDEPASRVEFELTAEEENRTLLRVSETRPLDVLDLIGTRLPGSGGGSYGPALVAA
jgi:uncharacterized protein YndB with AHSA1/START domain